MEVVCNIDEAKCWFLHNSSGSVLCVHNGAERVVNSFPEAKAFFAETNQLKTDC